MPSLLFHLPHNRLGRSRIGLRNQRIRQEVEAPPPRHRHRLRIVHVECDRGSHRDDSQSARVAASACVGELARQGIGHEGPCAAQALVRVLMIWAIFSS